ncbi:serine hydrolase domain-containing protein [Streptomyces sp. NPDC057963]|uniref:serine hydrolase domain-containing protein n=1 Tax=Streptomyces sp. NPDC057963 TaxID=3346290 RepID=UPI0036E1D942
MRSRLAPALVATALVLGATLPATAAEPRPDTAGATAPASPSAQDIVDALPKSVYTGALIRRDGVGAAMGPVVPDAYFRIGSTTKIFTQTIVLQLVAERRIGLDTPVRAYLPTLVPATYEQVTVGQLLDHTSGFPRPARTPGPDDGAGWWLRSVTPAGLLSASFAAAADRSETPPDPGSVQQYNGLNAFALGLIVEKVTGHSFTHELRHRIIRPLGLRHTSLPAADDPTIPSPHARVYVDGDEVTEQSPYPWAEGGMISTAADLDRFLTALFRGRLLPPAQQKLVFAVPRVDSATTNTSCPDGEACFSVGGLMRYTLPNGQSVWGKTGSRPGWDNGFFATPDLGHRVVYSLNPTGTDSGIAYIQRIIIASLMD